MSKRVLGLIPVLVIVAAVFAMPTQAGAPGREAFTKVSQGMPGQLPPLELMATLPELETVKPGEDIQEMSADGTAQLYWRVYSWSCIYGGSVYLAVDGAWRGYVTKKGTYKAGTLKTGKYHKFYAVDGASYSYWGPKKYYIYSYWSSFKWTIYC